MTDLAQIKYHITNVEDMQPEDFDTFDDYLNAVKSLFQNNFNSAVYDSTSELWSDRIDDYDDNEKTPIITLKKAIQNIMKKLITKREQTIQILEIAKKPFTIKEFVEATGMNPNTARRELGQGVKKGLFKRVSKGVYERL